MTSSASVLSINHINMGDKEQLLSMGFAADRVDWALRATRNTGLQPAMDHLLEHADDAVPVVEDEPDNAGSAGDADLEARSIKCSECGKIFRSQATASFHAEKSGHENFEESTEEIKPLTEEEKKAKLADLRAKLAEKRAKQEQQNQQEQKANEALRRKAGQDTSKIKEEMQVKEAQKEAERKRIEKLEDQRARAAVKKQIEADKRERAEKAAREKALREGKAEETPVVATAPKAAVKSSENPETRLQIRCGSGAPLVKTFGSDQTLVDVAEFVASEKLEFTVDTVQFTSTFPRKTYSKDEMRKTLKENGLTPSAVLMANVA